MFGLHLLMQLSFGEHEAEAYLLLTVDSGGSAELEGAYEFFAGAGNFVAANFWGQEGLAETVFKRAPYTDLDTWRDYITENGLIL